MNHSDFTVRVQDVQLVLAPTGDPIAEPLILGLRAREEGGLPGIIQPHDSGFVGTGIPRWPDTEFLSVYANVITAVGNVRSPTYETALIPTLPAPMRFGHLFPDSPADGE